MARKPQVRYFASRSAYYCQYEGKQYKLASGEDDSPNGPTYLAALTAFKALMERSLLTTAGNENTVRTLFNAYMDAIASKARPSTLAIKQRMLKVFVGR